VKPIILPHLVRNFLSFFGNRIFIYIIIIVFPFLSQLAPLHIPISYVFLVNFHTSFTLVPRPLSHDLLFSDFPLFVCFVFIISFFLLNIRISQST